MTWKCINSIIFSSFKKKLGNTTVIIEGIRLARHLRSTKSKYLMGCITVRGLAMVARHIDPIGNDAISSSETHLEKTDQEWRKNV